MANVSFANYYYGTEIVFFEQHLNDVITVTPELVRYLSGRGEYVEVVGTGLTIDGNGMPSGGTISAISIYSDSTFTSQIGSLTGINEAFATFFDYTRADTVFAGNDIISAENVSYGEIKARGGDDLIQTGAAFNGTVDGGTGNDTIVSAGSAQLFGNAGNDLIDISAAEYGGRADGGAGDDTLRGSAAGDSLFGGAGRDVIDAGAGSDYVSSADSGDTLKGGDGTDYLDLDRSASLTRFVADFSNASRVVTLSDGTAISGFEQIVFQAGAGNDKITGSSVYSTLFGNAGSDTLTAGGGGAALFGGEGNDSLVGGTGYDDLNGGDGADRIILGTGNGTNYYYYSRADGGDGADTISSAGTIAVVSAGDGNDRIDFSTMTARGWEYNTLDGDGGNDTILGGAGVDQMNGGGANDSLVGNAGNDVLDGGAGFDNLNGGAGNDTLWSQADQGPDTLDGGAGMDSALISRQSSGDAFTLNFSRPGTLLKLLDGTTLINIEQVSFQSGSGNDVITASNSTGQNSVRGGGGDDRLRTSANRGELYGDSGNDTLDGAAGDDTLVGGTGTDTAIMAGNRADYRIHATGFGDNVIVQDARATSLDGRDWVESVEKLRFSDGVVNLKVSSANTIIGGANADFLSGTGWGQTTVHGGGGADTFGIFFGNYREIVIDDFTFGADKLDLHGIFTTITAADALAFASDTAGGLTFNFDTSGTVTLTGITLAGFTDHVTDALIV
jgi:Ca2+-binding RTX toxin-like protein